MEFDQFEVAIKKRQSQVSSQVEHEVRKEGDLCISTGCGCVKHRSAVLKCGKSSHVFAELCSHSLQHQSLCSATR